MSEFVSSDLSGFHAGSSEAGFEKRVVEALVSGSEWEVVDDVGKADSDVFVRDVLEESIQRHTPYDIREGEVERVVDDMVSFVDGLSGLSGSEFVEEKYAFVEFLLGRNRLFTVELVGGRSVRPRVITWDEFSENVLQVVRQFRYESGGEVVIPDVVLLVSGVPLVVGEVKSVLASGDTAKSAMGDLRGYESRVPELFVGSLCSVGFAERGVDGDDGFVYPLYYRAFGSSEKFEFPWYDDVNACDFEGGLEAFVDLCRPERLCELYRFGQLFVSGDSGWVHIVARHQQFFVSKRIVEDVRRKVVEYEEGDGLEFRELVSHVQGSGKTLAMVFAARWVRSVVRKPWNDAPVTMLIVVDRSDLDAAFGDQIDSVENLVVASGRASSSEDLVELVQESSKNLIVTTIQKIGKLRDTVSNSVACVSDEVIVSFEDEVHRELLGVQASTYKNAFPNLIRYGFTGTPTDEIITEMCSGDEPELFHTYTHAQALREGVTVPLTIVDASPELEGLNSDELDVVFERELAKRGISMNEARRVIQKTSRGKIEQNWDEFVEYVAESISTDFVKNYANTEALGMVVCQSKYEAALFASLLQQKLGEECVKAVYSSDPSDPAFVRNTLEEHSVSRFQDKEDSVQLIVVCDMLLTGFDEPRLQCLYVNRNFSQDHTLLQALARVNRPRDGKESARVVDYKKNSTRTTAIRSDMDFSKNVTSNETLFEQYTEALEEIVSFFNCTLEELVHIANTDTDQLVQRVREDPDVYTELFSTVRSARTQVAMKKQLLQYESVYTLLEKLHNIANPTSENTLADTIGDAGGNALETVVSVTEPETQDTFTIDSDAFTDINNTITLQHTLLHTKHKADTHESMYDDVTFSKRAEELYSKLDSGTLSKQEVDDLHESIETATTLPPVIKDIQTCLSAENIPIDTAQDIHNHLETEAQVNEKPRRIASNLYDKPEFPLYNQHFSLIKDIVNVYKSHNT